MFSGRPIAKKYFTATATVVVLAWMLSCAQPSAAEVIESNIELEDAVMGDTVKGPFNPPVVVQEGEPDDLEATVEDQGAVVASEVELPQAGRLKEQQIVEIDFLIKQMIEQYEVLETKRQDLDKDLKFIRGQKKLDENRLNTITEEMRKVREQTEQVMGLNQQYSRQLTDIRLRMADQDQQYQLRIKELEDRVEKGGGLPAGSVIAAAQKELVIDKGAVAAQDNRDLIAMIDNINQEGERLKQDTAKVHYNMGNIYFHKREFKKAVTEYKKALKLVPTDAAAHFNLAYVSGEYLFDHPTAVKHYREYLLLSPDAPDVPAVKERLLQAELSVRVTIDSPIDKPELRQ